MGVIMAITSSTATGTRIVMPSLSSDLRAYYLGMKWDGSIFFYVIVADNGYVSVYNANDQSWETDDDAPKWDVPNGVAQALLSSAIHSHNTSQAEDQRYRETVELRERLAALESAARETAIDRATMRTAIMKEMMGRAAEIADSEGFCSEYDRLAEALGYEGREREYDVTVTISSFDVTIRVTATSSDNAYEQVAESDVDDAIRSFISNNSVSWDHYETERA
jgi:hypothetical protein